MDTINSSTQNQENSLLRLRVSTSNAIQQHQLFKPRQDCTNSEWRNHRAITTIQTLNCNQKKNAFPRPINHHTTLHMKLSKSHKNQPNFWCGDETLIPQKDSNPQRTKHFQSTQTLLPSHMQPSSNTTMKPPHPPPKAELETWKSTRINPVYPEPLIDRNTYKEQEEPKTHLQIWNCFYKSALSLWYCNYMEDLARAESAILGDGSHRGTARQPKSWNAIVMWRNLQEIPRKWNACEHHHVPDSSVLPPGGLCFAFFCWLVWT